MSHLSEELLISYLVAQRPGEQECELEEHLLTCSECVERAENLMLAAKLAAEALPHTATAR